MTNETNNSIKKIDDELDDFTIDFTTSSAISRITIKILAIYLPIFWLSGILVGVTWYGIEYLIESWIIRMFYYH